MERSKAIARLVGGAAVLAALYGTPQKAHAAGLVGAHTNSLAIGDFDGDGQTDYAYGYPQWSFGEGKVTVVYASEKIDVWNRDSPGILFADVQGNYFGDSIAAGDFDGDGYDDIAIGVPGDDHEGTNAGSMTVIYGSSNGLTSSGDQVIDQDSPGIANGPEANDYYAEVLATGDFNCDGYDDVAVGIPQEDLNAGVNAGALNVIYGTSGGLSTVNDWYHQNISGVSGDVSGPENFAGSLVAGNFDGDASAYGACDDIAIGVPGESSVQSNGGLFQVFYGEYSSGLSLVGDEYIHQDTQYVEESVQYGDMFATWIAAADYYPDAYDDIVVRAPFDQCGLPAGAMGFHFFRGGSLGFIGPFGSIANEIECVYVDAAVQEIVDAYTTCILDPGVCHCSEEFAFAVENDTAIAPLVQGPWMCTQKAEAAAVFCQSVAAQAGPSLSVQAADCIEASREAWQDCLGSEIEEG
jgi:hypothetical protein